MLVTNSMHNEEIKRLIPHKNNCIWCNFEIRLQSEAFKCKCTSNFSTAFLRKLEISVLCYFTVIRIRYVEKREIIAIVALVLAFEICVFVGHI